MNKITKKNNNNNKKHTNFIKKNPNKYIKINLNNKFNNKNNKYNNNSTI